MQPTVTYTNRKQGENIPQDLCYIWAQTLRQGNYFVYAQIVEPFYLHLNKVKDVAKISTNTLNTLVLITLLFHYMFQP